MESKQQAGGRPAVGDTPEASKVEAYATVGKRVLQRTGTSLYGAKTWAARCI